jgi:hypothetical protein
VLGYGLAAEAPPGFGALVLDVGFDATALALGRAGEGAVVEGGVFLPNMFHFGGLGPLEQPTLIATENAKMLGAS